jgi:hypothetical protein
VKLVETSPKASLLLLLGTLSPAKIEEKPDLIEPACEKQSRQFNFLADSRQGPSFAPGPQIAA